MTDSDSPKSSSDDGNVSAHPRRPRLPVYAAPQMADERNTYRVSIAPIACMRLDNGRFDFDSSFLVPDAKTDFAPLAAFARATPKARPSVFGHADPTGDDDYNKKLSARRARAVYAALSRDISIWEDLADTPEGKDAWGDKQDDRMLGALGFAGASRVQDFQTSAGDLDVDGMVGPLTRKKLFATYMDYLCSDDEGPFHYDPPDFLSRGAGTDGKADYQACSELNPVVILSTTELQTLSPTDRDSENAPNRRVVVFLFPNEIVIHPGTWPCPTVKEGLDGCRTRFWSDGEARRTATDERRRYAVTRDTFACRFYERLAYRSPCENRQGPVGPGVASVQVCYEQTGENVGAGMTVMIRYPDGSVNPETTDENGEVRMTGVKGERFEVVEVFDGQTRLSVGPSPEGSNA